MDEKAPIRLLHPLLLFLLGNQLLGLTLSFTKKNSPLRIQAFLISILLGYLAFKSWPHFIQSKSWPGPFLAGGIFGNVNLMFDRVLLRQWDYETDYLGPLDVPEKERKVSRREFGKQATASVRGAGTAWETANVPHFDETDHDFVPSRTTFLMRHGAAIVFCYYVSCLLADVKVSRKSFTGDEYIPFFTRLSDISTEEVISRVILCLAYWASTYTLIQTLFSLGAVMGVLTKPQELKYWRPLFGSVGTVYTLRNFWG
jgi:hypothetical protein